jgi:hypothetical protein
VVPVHLSEVRERKLALKLLGGVAIRFRCPSAARVPSLQRTYKDIDFATSAEAGRKLADLFRELGYITDSLVNNLNWGERQIFYDPQHGRQVDIFVGKFSMCHKIPFGECCLTEEEAATICPADLLLTKAQIVHLNEKDVRDMLVLLLDHAVEKNDRGINIERITSLTNNDWGFYHTVELNMEKTKRMLENYALTIEQSDLVAGRIEDLLAGLRHSPKTLAWKIRSRIGERVQWYEVPDEVC